MDQAMVTTALAGPPADYGFVSRDPEIQAIERLVLASQDSNELLVHGPAGVGKSTLLAHLARRWQRTGLVDQVFRFSYQGRAWTSGQIIRRIQRAVLGQAEQAGAAAKPAAAQLEQVVQHLRATRHLLILDAAEASTAAAAVPGAPGAAGRQHLRTLLSLLRGGRTLVLIGSREPGTWLTPDSPGPGSYRLPGLDTQAAAVLAERIDPALQDSLLLLAPFTAVIPTGPILGRYTELLLQHESVRSAGQVDLAAALGQAVDVGLAAPHRQLGYLVQVQPLLSCFLRGRLPGRPSRRDAAGQAHYELYRELGAQLAAMLISADHEQRSAGLAAAQAEYANLADALAHGLRAGRPILAIAGALDGYLDQTGRRGARRGLFDDTIAAYPEGDAGPGPGELAALHDLAGRAALDQHRLDDAKAEFEAALRLADGRHNWHIAASAHHQLGLVAQHQRRYGQAEGSYHRALGIKLQLGDQCAAADSYHQLGTLAQDRRRYAEAEASYRSALAIFLEAGDQRAAADSYHQLGTLAQDRREYAEAAASYRSALAIFLEAGDQRAAADSYHQLGTLAQDRREYAEAAASYRSALAIFLESGDQHGAADAYYRLGTLAHDQRRYAEAEASYRSALGITQQSGDQHSAALTHRQLGMLAREQQRYAEAEASYRQALEIFLASGDRDGAASTHHQLGTVARQQQRYAQAEASYRKALHIRQQSDPRAASSTAKQLGNVLTRVGQHGEAARVRLYAAMTWRQESGVWSAEDLEWLRGQRALIEPDEFVALVKEDVPAGLADDLIAAIAAGDPAAPGPPGS